MLLVGNSDWPSAYKDKCYSLISAAKPEAELDAAGFFEALYYVPATSAR